MLPARFSICTCNLWNTERWPEREPALRQFLNRFGPDVLVVQELREPTRDCVDAELAEHERISDPFAGWSCESNIWWRRRLFERIEHGALEYGSPEPARRLFWVRLRCRGAGGTLLVATVHLSHDAPDDTSGRSQQLRMLQTSAVIEALAGLRATGEPAWLAGDFNEAVQPGRMLHRAGFTSCFSALGLQPPPTFPAVPTAGKAPAEFVYNACYDWILATGPTRPLAAQSPRCFHGDLAPSDHWPVVAVYELDPAAG